MCLIHTSVLFLLTIVIEYGQCPYQALHDSQLKDQIKHDPYQHQGVFCMKTLVIAFQSCR